MAVNMDNPRQWEEDISRSVAFYNEWFLNFAPRVYRETRRRTTEEVKSALKWTRDLTDISPVVLRKYPQVLQTLRMSTAPPIARDRLIGLGGLRRTLVANMEDNQRLPPQMDEESVEEELLRVGSLISSLADPDIFPWLVENRTPRDNEASRAATIVADRLLASVANPIIRNAQEERQLKAMGKWLGERGYTQVHGVNFDEMMPGTFSFRLDVEGMQQGGGTVKVNIDAAVMPQTLPPGELPIFIEAKSAGDFTNTNKRRKEDTNRADNLRRKHGESMQYVLFLCGFFNMTYLSYMANANIDWVWEHRIDDLEGFGI